MIASGEPNEIVVIAVKAGTFYGVRMRPEHVYNVAPNTAFGFPSGIAVDAAGNSVIADTLNNLVEVLAERSGTFYGIRMKVGQVYTVAGGGNHGLGDGGLGDASRALLAVRDRAPRQGPARSGRPERPHPRGNRLNFRSGRATGDDLDLCLSPASAVAAVDCRDRRPRKTVRRLCGVLTQWRAMTNFELVTAADVQLMQGLAQRVTATRPDLVSSDASFGELAWIWGKGHASDGASWPRRLWFSGGDLVAWSWAYLPHQVRRSDGSVKDVTGAYLAYQVHPDHAGLVDEVIDWYDGTAAGIERTVMPSAADEFALKRWVAHGYETDLAALGDAGSWTQLNERDLTDVELPVLPDGFRFRTADEAGTESRGPGPSGRLGSLDLHRRGLPGRPADGGVSRRPAHPGGGAGRNDGILDDHVA